MDFLKKLDFNLYEQKILKSLLTLKEGNAKDISKNGQIPINKVYQIIYNLIKKGIILEINSKPKKFILNDFDLYIKEKLKIKQENILNIEKEYNKFKKDNLKMKKEIDFFIYKDLDTFVEKIIETYDEIDFFSYALIEKWEFKYSSLKATKEFIKRNGKVKFLGKITQNDVEVVKKWLKVGVEIRKLNDIKKSGFSVFDDKFSRISIQNNEFKTIWCENKDLNLILKEYFEILWEKGKPITFKNFEEDKIL